MNGARSTFKRKGYLLTALAAAVLLAASPGTASAQSPSIGFVGSSGTVAESASGEKKTLLMVTVRAGGVTVGTGGTRTVPPGVSGATIAVSSALAAYEKADGTEPLSSSISLRTAFASANDYSFYVGPSTAPLDMATANDTNWRDNVGTLKVTLGESGSGVTVNPGTFTVTVKDDDVAPVAEFKHVNAPNITLQESSSTTINVAIKEGTSTTDMQGVMTIAPMLQVSATPATTKLGACDAKNTDGTRVGNVLDIHVGGADVTITKGVFELGVGTPGTDTKTATYKAISVEACSDPDNFRDQVVTLGFVAASLGSGTMDEATKTYSDGNVTDGGSVTITVDSNETTPTVEFATTDINIDEGGTQSVYLVADTMQGDEVGMATIMVSGDARVSLSGSNVTAGADVDAYGNGSYTVAFGESANTSVTFSAAGDESLGDGETKMATATISSANGANIGTDDTLNITVRGSTSVPALPLIGQLLLALFLMAGGSRLYRRRRG